jgi:hypothetical protein
MTEKDHVESPEIVVEISEKSLYYYRMKENTWKPDIKEPPPVTPIIASEVTGAAHTVAGLADDPLMPWPHLRPEHRAHPAVWVPTHDRESILEPKPQDGPPGTIRLRVRDTNFPDPKHPDLYRLWIKPAENYLSVRTETSVYTPDNPPKLAFVDTHIIEDQARSPGGHWYPTRVRLVRSNNEVPQVTRFHLDFAARIAEELFRPL